MPKTPSSKKQKDSTDGLQIILTAFRVNFKAIENLITMWKEECKSSLNPARRILNLSKQCRACQKADMERFPTKFPSDIQQRVIFKIQTAIGEELEDINNNLKQLEDIQNKIKTHCSTIDKVFTANSNNLDINSITVATATCPSISDLLECNHELQIYFVTEYLNRKFSLQFKKLLEEESVNNFMNIWQEFDVLKSRLKNVYPLITYFLSDL